MSNRDHINVNQDYGLCGRAKKFDATSEQAKEAVQPDGDCPDKVEMRLKGVRLSANAGRETK